MMHTLNLLLWYVLMMGLLWSVFCRLVRTNHKTILQVRWAIFQLGAAALFGMAAPIYGWMPDPVVFAIAYACLCIQVVAARHWRGGVPAQFQETCHPKTTEPNP